MRADLNPDEAVIRRATSGVLEVLSKSHEGPQHTRMEALRLYTAENGWFTHEEDKLGTIEPGKFGDFVVLSDDFPDPKKVTDEGIKRLKSALTVVDGKVVSDQGVAAVRK